MNTIYNIIWNRELGRHVVTSELAARRSKSKSVRSATLALSCMLSAPGLALFSMPADAYVAGNGAVQGGAANTVVGDGAVGGDGCSAAPNAGPGPDGSASPLTDCLHATAVGTNANTYAATAIGTLSQADGYYTLAVGESAKATADQATAIGSSATASAGYSTAIGSYSNATTSDGLALGSYSVANTAAGVAGYVPTNANTAQAAAITNTTSTLSAASVGDVANGQFRQINGVAAGSENSDAVNVAQLKAAGNATNDEIDASKTHYYSINNDGTTFDNFNNDGATGTGSMAAGAKAAAGGVKAVAVGRTAVANGDESVAVGSDANTGGPNGVAIGANATAGILGNATAVGALASATSSGTFAGGTAASATGTSSTAVGFSSSASNNSAVAVGAFSRAAGVNSVAIGREANASMTRSTAVGYRASSPAADGVALGSRSLSNVVGGRAGYVPSSADSDHEAAINATTSTLGAASVGNTTTGQYRQIIGVAAGTSDSDAVNVAQLKAAGSATSDEITANKTHYYSVNENGERGGNYDNDGATGLNALAAGINASASAEGGIALGSSAVSDRAIGLASYVPSPADAGQRAAIDATTSTQGALSIGDADAGIFRQITGLAAGSADSDAVNVAQLKAVSVQVQAGAVHYYSVNDNGNNAANYDNTGATGANAIASGVAATAVGDAAVAMGNEAQANARNSVAIGNGADSVTEDGVALGSGSVADRAGAVAGYAPEGATNTQQAAIAATTSTQGAVSIGDADSGKFRQITGVAAGSVDSDAVNVAQLKAAGSATSDEIAASKTHYYSVNDGGKQSGNYSNDGATGNNAIAAGTSASASGKSAVAMGDGAQATAAGSVAIGNNAKATTSNSVALGSNSVVSRDNSVSVGSASNERQITHVAAGTADTDAVNVSQLTKSTGDINNRIDNVYGSLKGDINDMDDTLSAGIAGAMAAASLPQPYSAGASMTSAGIGNYRGQSSLAIGVSTISDNGKWVSKLAGTADSQGEFGVSAGVGYQW